MRTGEIFHNNNKNNGNDNNDDNNKAKVSLYQLF